MNWFHLIDADNNWVAQFRQADAAEAYVHELGKDINDYKLEFGPSKYPDA
jgi:hypothetical protein